MKTLPSIAFIAGAALAPVTTVQAAVFYSDAVNESVVSPGGLPTILTPSASWDPPVNPPYWVSYANTVPSAGGISPSSGAYPGAPAMVYRESLGASPGNFLFLRLWGDDTAEAFLNGTTLLIGNTGTAIGSPCVAPAKPSCQTGGDGVFVGPVLAYGPNSFVEFRAYQLFGGAFGIKYLAEFDPVPAPAALPLLASAIAFLGWAGLRRSA